MLSDWYQVQCYGDIVDQNHCPYQCPHVPLLRPVRARSHFVSAACVQIYTHIQWAMDAQFLYYQKIIGPLATAMWEYLWCIWYLSMPAHVMSRSFLYSPKIKIDLKKKMGKIRFFINFIEETKNNVYTKWHSLHGDFRQWYNGFIILLRTWLCGAINDPGISVISDRCRTWVALHISERTFFITKKSLNSTLQRPQGAAILQGSRH